jgi:WD40 repeat protein
MRSSLRETWRERAVLPAVHVGDVYAAAWSAKSGLVASVGIDGNLVLYAEGEGESPVWSVLDVVEAAHGPYEINHVTWCPRHDAACSQKGVEEMLVTTGDDGLVRAWKVDTPKDATGQDS